TFPAAGPWDKALQQPCTGWRPFADLPAPGTRVARGQPILTAFARARSVPACLAALRRAVGRLDRSLDPRQITGKASRTSPQEQRPVALTPTLNERAQRLADHAASTAAQLRIRVQTVGGGARVLNFGIDTPGGLQAGLTLARVCLANLAEVTLAPGEVAGVACPLVQ